MTRSVNEYMAQMFGAQYAWHNPLAKGKSRPMIWGIWPLSANGPNASPKMAAMPLPSFTQFRNSMRKMDRGDRQ